ncbi:MAG TPA: HTH domain-containing protein [Candidatus Elarobacter sp.]
MKSSRLLSMLLILQSAERRSARELAAALEVSERTIYRDVDALSASGVPVYAERGVYGGIMLSAGYRKALTQFGEDEIRALFISGSNPLGDLGLAGRERAQDAALHQLVAWGAVARIVEPVAIRDELLARARAIVAHHGAR